MPKKSSEEKYDEEIKKIKLRLSKFTSTSVFLAALSHLHNAALSDEPSKGMPWTILFVLKLAMLEGKEKGKEISQSQFNDIANKLFNIQHLACDISEGNIMLKLRPMLLQQSWYQQSTTDNCITLLRQMHWFTIRNNNHSREFKKSYGVTLESFYTISIFIITRTNKEKAGIQGINLYELLFYLTPHIPLIEITNYFSLIGIRVQDLSTFFKSHRLPEEKNQQSEYFQPSPLRFKPIIIDGNRALIPNKNLFTAGISSLVPDLLKKKLRESFKNEFGNDMESYVGELLEGSKLKYLNEEQILETYRRHSIKKGKVTDFIIEGSTSIIIECKAIEPGDIVKSSYSSELIYRHLQESFIKAIDQIQETTNSLKKTQPFKDRKTIAIVTTHEDFWFATGKDVNTQLGIDLESKYVRKYGNTPVELEKILFLPISTLETLIAAHNEKTIALDEVIEECMTRLNKPEGLRFTTSHAIEEILKNRSRTHELIVNLSQQWLDNLPEIFNKGKKYWQRNPIMLLRAHEAVYQRIHSNLDLSTRSGQE